MQDRPTAPELIAAVREFLQSEILPAISDQRLRFRTLVAGNVLSIVERELAHEEHLLRDEWARLVALDSTLAEPAQLPTDLSGLRDDVQARTVALCVAIRAGAADAGPWRAAVVEHVRRSVAQKLLVNNPKYLERVRDEHRTAKGE
jgi:Domain of unknown function (DUF6285)